MVKACNQMIHEHLSATAKTKMGILQLVDQLLWINFLMHNKQNSV